MAKIKCIIKRPEERYGHVTNISTTLANLQNIVEGPIEQVTIMNEKKDKPGICIICNEEGKLRGLVPSIRIGHGALLDVIVGTSVIIGFKDGELVDIPISFQTWKTIMFEWGNL